MPSVLIKSIPTYYIEKMSVDGRVSLYSASLLPVITMSVLKHVPRLLFSEFLNKATDDGAYTHILNSI